MAQMSFSLAAADMIALVNWYGDLFSIGILERGGFCFFVLKRRMCMIGMVRGRGGSNLQ